VKTVAVVNHKGGVGKTTTAVCLSGALVEQGRRVLLIDLDPQASASKWLEVNDSGRALLDTLIDDLPVGHIFCFRGTRSMMGMDAPP